MANEEQVAIVRQGTAVWQQWRMENPEVRVDLSSANFSNADLNGANFSNADLMDAKHSPTILTALFHSRASLSDANFRRADLRRADLRRAHLLGATLTGAQLSGADLTEADLIGANFNGADLTGAKLGGADLTGANLSGANFNGANLSGAVFISTDLRRTDLSDADLSDADLSGANFHGADLSRADLSRAFIADAVFTYIDLSEVKGLETVHHRFPSSISIDTIYKSKGQIPAIFLRGCGVPDIFIEYMHALTAKPEFYSCFISYSHTDAAFANRLHDTLQGKGVRCWLDEKDAKLGVLITHNIESGIRLTDKFLLCCSKESLHSGWVNFEIDLALHREQELRQGAQGDLWRIIPLDLDGHLFSPGYSGEGLRIRNRLAGDFTGWKTDSDKFDREIARVIQAIRIEGGQ